jgi:tetratricopeptide (TPR) repeat protein
MGLYVGLVFAYGSLAYFNSHIGLEHMKRALTGVVTASALLHFYYDGFIWKVREKSTAESLGLSGGGTATSKHRALPLWALHGLKWTAAFIIPLVALCSWELRGAAPELARRGWVSAALPRSGYFHGKYASALAAEHQFEPAEREYEVALQLNPELAVAHYGFANLLRDEARFDPAISEYEKAVQLNPGNGEYHFRLAETLQRIGHIDEAIVQLREAVRLSPKIATPHLAYASALAALGMEDDARAEFAKAVELDPKLAHEQR